MCLRPPFQYLWPMKLHVMIMDPNQDSPKKDKYVVLSVTEKGRSTKVHNRRHNPISIFVCTHNRISICELTSNKLWYSLLRGSIIHGVHSKCKGTSGPNKM
ncbi:hypothetical protein VNO77_40707 [Canavalia gladiata]|uniref:Uncharacterized protein n=1 Tax=Canavalia gladiata TaxID=3824 RepID=A0AAN9JXV3_CANGL